MPCAGAAGRLFKVWVKERIMKLWIAGVAAFATVLFVPAANAADGKEIYAKACALCHNNMPPKLGDKAAWEPRIKTGPDALAASVIKGKGAMPPNAGNKSLSEADIRAAVEYMVSQSK
jgi:cytochrome c5